MTRYVQLPALCILALIVCFQSCQCTDDKRAYDPIRFDEFLKDNVNEIRYKNDEILVLYKGTPSQSERDSIKQNLRDAGINVDSLTIKSCNSCSAYIELWQAKDIHTVIHGEEIRAGTVSGGSKGVGEDSIAVYSLNFTQRLPVEQLPKTREFKFRDMSPVSSAGKDTVIIAVLDTGTDTLGIIPPQYLWRNVKEKQSASTDADGNCYEKDTFGWNFTDHTANIRDDNPGRHGTIISQLIIREFASSPKNFVQLMTLKTHDKDGYGDLFSTICALHYAIDKGANIINASWGFYYYQPNPHPYLDSLITKVMSDKGILFVTASGNKIDEIDALAKARHQAEYGVTIPDTLLRNLNIHNFYPACLSDAGNNVVVATTTDGAKVSPTQNYSNRYVDFAVVADSVNATSMRFEVPNSAPMTHVSGSSFATAILSGKIGALLERSTYDAAISKGDVITKLEASPGAVNSSSSLESRKQVNKGRYIKHE